MSIHSVKPYKAKLNVFNLGHQFDGTAKPGYVYPVLCLNYNPNDKFRIDFNELIRLQPLSSPAFLNCKVRFDVFRVDTNIVWPDFLKFIKETGSEENPTTWAHIKIPSGGFAKGSLADFLGIGVGRGAGVEVDAVPFRAYNKILNDWYINSNLQSETTISTASGLDITTPTALRKANLRKDRFTDLQLSVQRGGDVILPIGTGAPVYAGADNGAKSTDALRFRLISGGDFGVGSGTVGFQRTSDDVKQASAGFIANSPSLESGGSITPSNLYADLSNVTGVSLNLLNSAERLNMYRTLSLFAGDRYPEWQRVMWGINSSDARLQRSEWLGSYKMPVVVSEVLQQSETTDTSPQGTMAGHGFSYGKAHMVTPVLNEYGYLFVMMTILPRVEYDQGLPRKFSKSSPFDYALPIFAKMPMQPVKNKELYLQDSTVVDSDGNQVNEGTLGFAPIFDEERYSVSHVAGDLHDTLSQWVVKRSFSSLPVLNSSFIQYPTGLMDSIFAVNEDVADPFIFSIEFKIKALRKLPKVGLPSF